MHNLRMIDTQGGGIKRVFMIQRNRFFPLPDYELSADKVRVRIYGRILDKNYTELLYENTELLLQKVFLLDKVQKNRIELISREQLKQLKKEGLIEGKRYPNFYISSGLAKMTGEEVNYMNNRGIEDEYCKKIILDYLKIHGTAKRIKLENILLPKMPDILTNQKKKNKIQNILQALRRDQKIKVVGKVWRLP